MTKNTESTHSVANEQTGHTKGPWKRVDIYLYSEAADGTMIGLGVMNGDPEHQIANAQLASAAPELLVACNFLMSQVAKLAERSFAEEHEEWLLKCDAMNCGRRAVAKALNS